MSWYKLDNFIGIEKDDLVEWITNIKNKIQERENRNMNVRMEKLQLSELQEIYDILFTRKVLPQLIPITKIINGDPQ